jgi:hypothetical protein
MSDLAIFGMVSALGKETSANGRSPPFAGSRRAAQGLILLLN